MTTSPFVLLIMDMMLKNRLNKKKSRTGDVLVGFHGLGWRHDSLVDQEHLETDKGAKPL